MKCELPERFMSKVEKRADGCWIWTAHRNWKGYGAYWVDGRPVGAHRYAYEKVKGPIPAGLQIDHLCRVRHCVNPEHMEAVTCQENLLRGDTIAAKHANATECCHGHPFTPENTYYYPSGKRECRTCQKQWAADRAERMKQCK